MLKSLSLGIATVALVSTAAQAFEVHREHLTPVTWQYDLRFNDEIDGDWDFNITDDGAEVRIFGTTNWPSHNTSETDTAVMESESLWPVSLVVDGDFGGTLLDVNVTWSDVSITGEMAIHRAGEEEATIHSINADAVALSRLSSFGLVRAADLQPGMSEDVTWFNSQAGSLQTVSMTVGEMETIEVPAGTFEVFPVTFASEQLANILYVTTSLPRDLVRVDVVGMPMVFELREVTQPE